MKDFMGIDFGNGEQVPDATTLCKFRKLLTQHELQKKFFDLVQKILKDSVKEVTGGTIVDATIIEASSSRKNKEKKPDPEMHSTRKGTSYRINRQRGTFIRHYGDSLSWQEEKKLEQRKSSVRRKVEYVFHLVKDIFHWRKVRYRGIAKDAAVAWLLCASANIYMLATMG